MGYGVVTGGVQIGDGLGTDWLRIGYGLVTDWLSFGYGLVSNCLRICFGWICGRRSITNRFRMAFRVRIGLRRAPHRFGIGTRFRIGFESGGASSTLGYFRSAVLIQNASMLGTEFEHSVLSGGCVLYLACVQLSDSYINCTQFVCRGGALRAL